MFLSLRVLRASLKTTVPRTATRTAVCAHMRASCAEPRHVAPLVVSVRAFAGVAAPLDNVPSASVKQQLSELLSLRAICRISQRDFF